MNATPYPHEEPTMSKTPRLNKAARTLIAEAEELGFTWGTTRQGHLRFTLAGRLVFAAGTPSDHRAHANASARLRRVAREVADEASADLSTLDARLVRDGYTGHHAATDLAECAQVAVYGTLREGQGNWRHYLRRAPARTLRLAGWQMQTLGGFPGASPTHEPNSSIVIELYDRVTPEEFQGLDRLEGHPRFYTRRLLELADGATTWIYDYPGTPHGEVIADGDWVRFDHRYGDL